MIIVAIVIHLWLFAAWAELVVDANRYLARRQRRYRIDGDRVFYNSKTPNT